MLTPLSSVQIYYIAEHRISRIVQYVVSQFELTIWISVWISIAVTFFSGLLMLIVDQSFFYLFGMVFVGFCGSSYELSLQNNIISSFAALQIAEILIFITGLLLRSAFIASFLFEGVQKIRHHD